MFGYLMPDTSVSILGFSQNCSHGFQSPLPKERPSGCIEPVIISEFSHRRLMAPFKILNESESWCAFNPSCVCQAMTRRMAFLFPSSW